jgi:dihydrolipoamide dehydrogenase
MDTTFDAIVLGGGPGGYPCAIRLGQLGLKVACVEEEEYGGVCLNWGCIPSKALIANAHFVEKSRHIGGHGIKVGPVEVDVEKMQEWKGGIVKKLTGGVRGLLKANGAAVIEGRGKLVDARTVEVALKSGGTERIKATKAIIIATGSATIQVPGFEFDGEREIGAREAVSLRRIPKRLVVVGGGVIGLEMGSVWARLGAKVTVVEYLDSILGGMDGEVAKQFQRMLAKQGMEFKLGAKVTGVAKAKKGATVTFEPVKGGEAETIDADVVLIATGRRPYTDNLGLEEAGVELERGRVKTDAHYQTNIKGIYAIGDVIAGPMLAHKAEDEGIAVAEILAGQRGHVNYDAIPSVVYTSPEVASVGKTEEELKKAGIDYKVGKFPFTANGRARAMLHTDGLVKILADKATDRVLGAHIVGFGAGEMIHELTVLMEFGGSSEDLARTTHAHPTMSEAVREAALATFFKPIHI